MGYIEFQMKGCQDFLQNTFITYRNMYDLWWSEQLCVATWALSDMNPHSLDKPCRMGSLSSLKSAFHMWSCRWDRYKLLILKCTWKLDKNINKENKIKKKSDCIIDTFIYLYLTIYKWIKNWLNMTRNLCYQE
jgi:hypothetical protein